MNVTPDSQPNALAEPTPSAQNSQRYFAWLYSPPELRPTLQTLLAIEADVRGVLRPGIDHRVAHVRLEWWSEESARLTAGRPVHPLTRTLPSGISIEGLIATTVWDLASATFGTRAEVAGYCERWAASMTQPLVNGQPVGIAIGTAVREIELLSGLASEASAGRLRVPLDELERAGIDPDALAKTPWPAKLCAVLRERHRELRAALAAHTGALPREHQSATRGVLVWAALANRQSLRAEMALPGEAAAGGALMLADGFHAWRSARRAQNSSFRIDQTRTKLRAR